MRKVTEKVVEGFTPGAKIYWYTWEGFGWFGQLQVELDGEFYVISAGGVASGDHGEMKFKIFEDLTQTQVDRMRIVAHKTSNKSPNCKPQTQNCKLKTPNSKLPTANSQLKTPNSKLQTANSKLPTANF